MQLQRLKVDFEKQKEQASLGGALKGAKIVGKMSGLSKEMPRGGGGGGGIQVQQLYAEVVVGEKGNVGDLEA
jgi:hypothetical protein